MKAKPAKCVLFRTKVAFLGRTVSRNGVKIDPQKIAAVKEWFVPSTSREVHPFLQFMSYHRDHVNDYVAKSAILYELTKPNHPFQWTKEHQYAFDALRNSVISALVLGYPDSKEKFILDTDASDTQIGAELSQYRNGVKRIICYGRFVLKPTQRRYCTTRRKLLAIVRIANDCRLFVQ